MKEKLIRLENLTKNITIIKRSGEEEPFHQWKLDRVLDWATAGNKIMAIDILHAALVKVNNKDNKIDIKDLYRALKDTARSRNSVLTPGYTYVAAKLDLLDLYRDAYGVKDKRYPHLDIVLKKGVEKGLYDSLVYEHYSRKDIEYLNSLIVQERDYLFTDNALNNFNHKYCKNLTPDKKLELPQHTYMRVAMGIFYNLPNRVELCEELYNTISLHLATFGSPVMINSFTPKFQPASCVLSTVGNDTTDIANKIKTAMLYTKGAGGLGFDVTLIQAVGSYTKKGVKASGIVPYIREFQVAIKSMMQGDNRRGMAVITCHWWHYEIEDFLLLKDNGGTEDTRAKDLKYAMATNKYFLDRVETGEDVYLFDPLDAEDLYWAKTDEEFEFIYEALLAKPESEVRRLKVNARDLYKKYVKYYFETGNVYETRLSNINPNMTNRKVNSSNLCSEILEPSRPGKYPDETYTMDENGKPVFHQDYMEEETALCNLASYNLKIFLPEYREKYNPYDIVHIMQHALDNMITIGYYPRASGKYTNDKYRYKGLGVSNYAYYLAKKKVKFSDYNSAIETYKLFQELNYLVTKSNIELAKIYGKCDGFEESLWAEGKLVYDLGNPIIKDMFKEYFNREWYAELKAGVAKYGVRGILTQAIAPTASSATAIGVLESIEPILKPSYSIEGSIDGTVVVPEYNELHEYYELAYLIDQKMLILNSAVRQLWIDQSQSVNLYIAEENRKYDYIMELLLLANRLGVKTSYYLNSDKDDLDVVRNLDKHCDSCGA